MVGFIGFLILAVGGGGLALYLGVPPMIIGAYVIGLLALGAITGFSTGSDGGGGGSGGGGSRSSGGSGGVTDAVNGFLDGLGGSSGGSDRSSRSSDGESVIDRMRDRGSSSDYPSELQDRVVGGSSESGDGSSGETGGSPDGGNSGGSPVDINHTEGTNDEDYISGQRDDNNMSDAPVESLEAEIERVINEIGEEEEREQQEVQELDQAKEELVSALKELQQHENLEQFIIAINKEGLRGKSPADQSATIEKYAEKYLGHEPGIQEIQEEIKVLADIEDKFENASKEMQDVERKEKQDLKEEQQAEKELAEVARNLDHLLDASQELQQYFEG